MNIAFEQTEQRTQFATLSMEQSESVYVLHPKQIVAFRGNSAQREDSFLNLPGIYRKKRFVKARISGPSQFILGLPNGYCTGIVPIEEKDDLLFEFRNVLFYTEGLEFTTHVQTVKNVMITRDLAKIKFKGPGTLGLLTAGPLYITELDPVHPIYVDMACLVAYPQQAKIRLCVYGNTLSSQNMNYQWEITGEGRVLLQPCKPDRAIDEQMQNDGMIRRILREI
ncbi:MAG TPA: AIM24 family protein, partial [Bacilli bacterium]